jgi:hypothetical protein
MKKSHGARAALVAACALSHALLVACGNGSVQGTGVAATGKTPTAADGVRKQAAPPAYADDARFLADHLEADLLAQGVEPGAARAIALGALEGSLAALNEEGGKSLALIDLKGFLPGFLKGAFGVAKSVLAGSPLGVVGTIVESVVKGFSKKPETPKDLLAQVPALALEALLGKAGGAGGASAGSAGGAGAAGAQDVLAALLAAGRGVIALPPGTSLPDTGGLPAASEPGALQREMVQKLIASLVRQPGVGVGELASLLPALQDSLQQRLLMGFPSDAGGLADAAQGGPASFLPRVLQAISEGQFSALLGLEAKEDVRANLIGLLLQKGTGGLLQKLEKLGQAGTQEGGLGLELLRAFAQGAARPVQALPGGGGQTKQELLQSLAQTLTRTVLELPTGTAPMKRQALEASLLGLSKGMIATDAVNAKELAEVYASVSRALAGESAKSPTASVGTGQTQAQPSVPSGDTDLKRELLLSALRGLAGGSANSTPRDELLEALLAVVAGRSKTPATGGGVDATKSLTAEEIVAILAQVL